MAKKTEQQKKRPRASLLTKIVLLVLLAAVGWQLYGLQGKVAAAQEEKERYAAQVEQTKRENDALSADIAEGPTREKIEEIARDELGLVTPNEYVFDDLSN